MNEVKYFIRNLKKYMVENNIKTERELATKLGCSQPTVHNTLTENTPLTMGFITKTAEATGMSIVQLFSPDPKQYGSAVEGVQDENAVAMMELMKKQMEDLKRENEQLSDENDARVEDVKDMEKRLDELQQASIKIEGNLRKHITELQKENTQLREENENLLFTNAEPLKLALHIDSDVDSYNRIDIGSRGFGVGDIHKIDPFEKKVTLDLYFDEIHIK